MLKISKKSQYGLRAMVQLAKNYKAKRILSAKTISEKEGIPFEFLEKIILQLEKAGLVKSKKGVQGGYVLSHPPKKISANDVVSILENPPTGEKKSMVNCTLCGRKSKCATKDVWVKLDIALNKTLEKITLKNLI